MRNKPEDILHKLADLKKQATEERSHFYVRSVVGEAIREIEFLRKIIFQFQLAHGRMMITKRYPISLDKNGD